MTGREAPGESYVQDGGNKIDTDLPFQCTKVKLKGELMLIFLNIQHRTPFALESSMPLFKNIIKSVLINPYIAKRVRIIRE